MNRQIMITNSNTNESVVIGINGFMTFSNTIKHINDTCERYNWDVNDIVIVGKSGHKTSYKDFVLKAMEFYTKRS